MYSSVRVIRMPCDIRLTDQNDHHLTSESVCVYKMKRTGPCTEPWGTPYVKSEKEDFILFAVTTCALSCRYAHELRCLRRGADEDRDSMKWRRLYLTLHCPITRMMSALSWAMVFKPFQCLMNGAGPVTRQRACTTTLENKENKVKK